MSIFPLTNEDKETLKRLNQNPSTVFALKKLFLNVAIKGTIPADVQTLAAERIAIDILQSAFHQLSTIQSDNHQETKRDNVT